MEHLKVASKPADTRISRSYPGAPLRPPGFGLHPFHPIPLHRKRRSGADQSSAGRDKHQNKEGTQGGGWEKLLAPPGTTASAPISMEAVAMAAGCV